LEESFNFTLYIFITGMAGRISIDKNFCNVCTQIRKCKYFMVIANSVCIFRSCLPRKNTYGSNMFAKCGVLIEDECK